MEKTLNLKNKFNIEDIVYHRISGEKFLITMVRIVVDSTHKPVYQYCVNSTADFSNWVDELILVSEKPLIEDV